MTLRARFPVLYASRQYKPGDVLPGTDPALVQAWVDSGAAVWDETDTYTKEPKVELNYTPGLRGMSSDGDPNAMVGRVTQTPQRERTDRQPQRSGKKVRNDVQGHTGQ